MLPWRSRGRAAARRGPEATLSAALDELRLPFGPEACKKLQPLVYSDWVNLPSIGGAYSHAISRLVDIMGVLGAPYYDRVFFPGEATHPYDFSAAHGAFETGLRAARELLARW
ncbi:FAD-dependent oxidoreductase [Rhizobium anhuiense]|uniref:FAD-dependent oxidoreductase n=1 Tax=Rhizobium anhuiense TaxID=1184720 RepID=UPI0035709873